MSGTNAKAQLIDVTPAFFVRDIFTTAEFYRDVLGFTFDQFYVEPPSFVILTRGGARLMLKQSDTAARQQGGSGVDSTYDAYFYTDDVDALAREFEAGGALIVLKPITRAIYNGRELVVRDCDGRDLMFGQLL